jgi:hypothetical protein
MNALRNLFIVLALVLLAAHFSRAGNILLAGLIVLLALLLLVREPWAGWVLRIVLVAGAMEWLLTLFRLVRERRALGDDWARLAAILATVSAVTLLAAWAVRVSTSDEAGDLREEAEAP